ncbi:LysO family transporter [Alkaliphilus peptidifermentans]|uniref:DUF340 domain-containing protein n=1 Tax=Alkaliphilus peptidifermentans DSM 18978 TaxID=1120976 RepID=A0A1G5L5N3_9FIRM|nr:LysO family transporter [Alkaliphilus peptidifermentans]SCZ08177.1 Membrane protein of unknown function [Alkaliphilus peptidifermentans DSM 18978]
MNILLYLLILVVGAFIGYKNLLKSSLLNKVGIMQNCALLFLLFIMGVKIGIDKEIVYSFGTIGVQGVVLAFFTIVFSILGVKSVSWMILKTEVKTENDH